MLPCFGLMVWGFEAHPNRQSTPRRSDTIWGKHPGSRLCFYLPSTAPLLGSQGILRTKVLRNRRIPNILADSKGCSQMWRQTQISMGQK